MQWDYLIKTVCKFDAYIESVDSGYSIYLLNGRKKIYLFQPERNKMWYDFPAGSPEHDSRSGGIEPAAKKVGSSVSKLFQEYLSDAFGLWFDYPIDNLFSLCKEPLYLAPIVRDILELHIFDVAAKRIVEKRKELMELETRLIVSKAIDPLLFEWPNPSDPFGG